MGGNYLPWKADWNEFIAISVYNDNTPVDAHMHDFSEIVFIAQGSCLHHYHKNEMMLIPGDVLFIAPHEAHSYSINSRTVIYNCLFYPEALDTDLDRLKEINGVNALFMAENRMPNDSQKQEILHINPADSSYVVSILDRMIVEQRNKNSGFGVVQKSNLILLISALGRLWDNQFKGCNYFFNEKRNLLAEALSFIESNFHDELNVRQLAKKAYMSPDHFRKVFKEVTGLSTTDYINKVRISKSIGLLDDRNLSIGKVAEMVGIGDVNYFTRLFHAKLGYTPSEYRKKTEKC